MRDSGVRQTPFEIPASGIITLDVSEFTAFWFSESLNLGTGAGEISISFGDQREFFKLSPGDFMSGLNPLVRIDLQNNTVVIKKGALMLSALENWRAWNTNRGI